LFVTLLRCTRWILRLPFTFALPVVVVTLLRYVYVADLRFCLRYARLRCCVTLILPFAFCYLCCCLRLRCYVYVTVTFVDYVRCRCYGCRLVALLLIVALRLRLRLRLRLIAFTLRWLRWILLPVVTLRLLVVATFTFVTRFAHLRCVAVYTLRCALRCLDVVDCFVRSRLRLFAFAFVYVCVYGVTFDLRCWIVVVVVYVCVTFTLLRLLPVYGYVVTLVGLRVGYVTVTVYTFILR